MGLEVTILGCGSSAGTPVIGCDCDVCTSENPNNKRTRASIVVKQDDTTLLVDTSPDLRQQALREELTEIHAIFTTHFHADHVMGIDDIRSFNYKKNNAIPLYCDAATMANMRQSFGYIFRDKAPNTPWYKPQVTPYEVECAEYESFTVNGKLKVQTFLQYHGKMPCAGIRVGDFAYSTDVNNLPEQSFQTLENLDVWVVDCLRYEPAPTHAHLDLTLEWIERIKPKRAVLTHMSHSLDYDTLMRESPDNVFIAYDGMKIAL